VHVDIGVDLIGVAVRSGVLVVGLLAVRLGVDVLAAAAAHVLVAVASLCRLLLCGHSLLLCLARRHLFVDLVLQTGAVVLHERLEGLGRRGDGGRARLNNAARRVNVPSKLTRSGSILVLIFAVEIRGGGFALFLCRLALGLGCSGGLCLCLRGGAACHLELLLVVLLVIAVALGGGHLFGERRGGGSRGLGRSGGAGQFIGLLSLRLLLVGGECDCLLQLRRVVVLVVRDGHNQTAHGCRGMKGGGRSEWAGVGRSQKERPAKGREGCECAVAALAVTLLLELVVAVWLHATHKANTAAQGEPTGAICSESVESTRREQRRSGQSPRTALRPPSRTAAAPCPPHTLAQHASAHTLHTPPHHHHPPDPADCRPLRRPMRLTQFPTCASRKTQKIKHRSFV
jgi:hypothetical protein